ncbi:membrane hypothetical protein [Xenorhabdus bovienii str. puntauvense]|uniref:Uncharacterized protein n=1 Tax=Xenorhabdus bovienii str. puntauvense TaxID=1398201 RepID=A0A077NC39_XENBV|nr:hypothetical protein [Xenorhabdus bovienii]MCG3463826.1 hypothetical protein [Xenorhabdus bovienii]CDG96524.1 membrane hypothetical protein [Xenorhabdus bovienii str. puntauvense]
MESLIVKLLNYGTVSGLTMFFIFKLIIWIFKVDPNILIEKLFLRDKNASDEIKDIIEDEKIDKELLTLEEKENQRLRRSKKLGITNYNNQIEVVKILNSHPEGYSNIKYFKAFNEYLYMREMKLTIDYNKINKNRWLVYLLWVILVLFLFCFLFFLNKVDIIPAIVFVSYDTLLFIIIFKLTPPSKESVRIVKKYLDDFYRN